MDTSDAHTPYVIGLTGGIGSGKTSVARSLEALGYKVFNADKAGHRAYLDPTVKKQVLGLLGKEAYTSEGKVNRSYIANRVFHNLDLLEQLNSLIHPHVRQQFMEWAKDTDHEPFVFREAAILIESGSAADCAAVITVAAPEATRTERVMLRDRTDKNQVKARMAKQLTDAERRIQADYEIVNDGVLPVIPQVLSILDHLNSRFGGQSRIH